MSFGSAGTNAAADVDDQFDDEADLADEQSVESDTPVQIADLTVSKSE